MHVTYATHIASLHYIENFSTYVVSRRHLHMAYFTTSLQEHREVKRSKGQGQQCINTVAFWNVRTKSRLFTQLVDLNLADESSCMQREKRIRACKLYDAYRIIALYRELFDVCRFAKVNVKKKNTVAFWNVRTKS